ncbi:amidohydrolase family protein [Bdellovibrionota bacterium]
MPSVLISNTLAVLTLAPGQEILENGEILIKDGEIVGVGEKGTLSSEDAERIDAHGGIVMPGFVNSHAHLPMSFFRGICHSHPEVLYEVVYPVEKHLLPSEVYPLALLGLLETTRCGVTCTGDHYFHEEEVAKAVQDLGVRATLGEHISSSGGPLSSPDLLERGIKFATEWKNRHPLITTILSPHASDTVKPEWFEELIKVSQKENLGLHLHVAQSRREVAVIEERYQKSPVQHMSDLGVLGPKTLAAHCIHVNPKDIELLREHETKIAHCPTSQLLFEQLAPLPSFLHAGISVSLSTDGSCSNDDMDLLKEMRITALAHSAQHSTPHMFQAMDLIKMATIEGAKALGLEKTCGSLEAGKRADLIILNADSPRMAPLHDIPNTIVFAASTDEIDLVMVDGKTRYSKQDGWPGIKSGNVIKDAEAATISLLKRAYKADPSIRNLFETRFWKEVTK